LKCVWLATPEFEYLWIRETDRPSEFNQTTFHQESKEFTRSPKSVSGQGASLFLCELIHDWTFITGRFQDALELPLPGFAGPVCYGMPALDGSFSLAFKARLEEWSLWSGIRPYIGASSAIRCDAIVPSFAFAFAFAFPSLSAI
jgi:hypothetical protein